MDNGSRKASDILLDLENKLNQLISMVHAQDLNLKILSNKLNMVMEKIKESPAPSSSAVNPYTVAADEGKMSNTLLQNRVAPPQMIKVSPERLPMEENPQPQQNTRRTSRPETTGSNRQSPQPFQAPRKVGIQDPRPPDMSQYQSHTEATARPSHDAPESAETQFQAFENLSPAQADVTNKVAVTQRITEKSGKSVFLAEVEIFDESGSQIFKTRTNGVGKWQASLPIGNYRVKIGKRESVTKQKIEKLQSITVDGRVSQLILDQIIIDK